jgi:NAD(P)-dependent dehydrogenase (short-subunit alcohol dehydrogenase family)
MTAGVRQLYDQQIAAGVFPMRRWGQPGDVADAVALLASGQLRYSTGECLHVDGGFHIRRL